MPLRGLRKNINNRTNLFPMVSSADKHHPEVIKQTSDHSINFPTSPFVFDTLLLDVYKCLVVDIGLHEMGLNLSRVEDQEKRCCTPTCP